jgi:hypothetical protein
MTEPDKAPAKARARALAKGRFGRTRRGFA